MPDRSLIETLNVLGERGGLLMPVGCAQQPRPVEEHIPELARAMVRAGMWVPIGGHVTAPQAAEAMQRWRELAGDGGPAGWTLNVTPSSIAGDLASDPAHAVKIGEAVRDWLVPVSELLRGGLGKANVHVAIDFEPPEDAWTRNGSDSLYGWAQILGAIRMSLPAASASIYEGREYVGSDNMGMLAQAFGAWDAQAAYGIAKPVDVIDDGPAEWWSPGARKDGARFLRMSGDWFGIGRAIASQWSERRIVLLCPALGDMRDECGGDLGAAQAEFLLGIGTRG